jgi:transcriptional regulator
MPEKSAILGQVKDLSTKQENETRSGVNAVNSTVQENIRAVILLLLEKGFTKAEIGKQIGYSGNYVSMILNYKTFPGKAEDQIKLMHKFNDLLNKINEEMKKDVRTSH